jgi:hypothetical protein
MLRKLILAASVYFLLSVAWLNAQSQIGNNIADHLLIKNADKDR